MPDPAITLRAGNDEGDLRFEAGNCRAQLVKGQVDDLLAVCGIPNGLKGRVGASASKWNRSRMTGMRMVHSETGFRKPQHGSGTR